MQGVGWELFAVLLVKDWDATCIGKSDTKGNSERTVESCIPVTLPINEQFSDLRISQAVFSRLKETIWSGVQDHLLQGEIELCQLIS